MKKILSLFLATFLGIGCLTACGQNTSNNLGESSSSEMPNSSITGGDGSGNSSSSDLPGSSGGEDDKTEEQVKDPIDNGVKESEYNFDAPQMLPVNEAEQVTGNEDAYVIENGDYRLVLEKAGDVYSVKIVTGENNAVKFQNMTPAQISVTTNKKLTQKETISGGYTSSGGNVAGGITGKAVLETTAGSKFAVYDEYYVYGDLFNVRRTVVCEVANETAGYTTNYSLEAKASAAGYTACEYFIPANIYCTSDKFLTAGTSALGYAVSDAKAPTPMAMMRVKETGDVLSICRKSPYVNTGDKDSGGYSKSKEAKYASIGIYKGSNVGVKLDYPCQEEGVNTLAHKYAEVSTENDLRFDATIYVTNSDGYTEAMTDAYQKHLSLQEIPEAEVDLEAAYKYNIEDLNAMAYSRNDVTLLPFARYVETGTGFSYYSECGYIGMQISLGYEMWRYGLQTGNAESKKLGLSILNMWANTATYPGTDSGVFRCYRTEGGYGNTAPTLRIMTDGMEGMLNAVRLAESVEKSLNISAWKSMVEKSLNISAWKSMVEKYADFLVRAQNSDGSWYRAYDYDGKKCVAGNRFNIPINADTIADSKLNTQIPIRFLVRMYEYTGNTKYLETAKKAGEYVVNEIIPQGQFSGGTLDTQGVVDRESGIFCEYAMNALYSATNEAKWLNAAIQAAVYSFSWTYTFDFIVYNTQNYKAGIATSKGYTAGMSVISTAGYGADSFMSYLYYDFFKLYVWTGDEVFLKMADLSQNHTKRIMDLNGEFDYKYRSYMIEATNISLFRFITAEETGVWLPWITCSNVEPMTNMKQTFGVFDIAEALKGNTMEELTAIIEEYGAGGKAYGEIR